MTKQEITIIEEVIKNELGKKKSLKNSFLEFIKQLLPFILAIISFYVALVQFQKQETIKQKMILKHEAILSALRILNANTSHFLYLTPNKIDLEYNNIKEIRECHNKLSLCVDDPKLVTKFVEMMTCQMPSNSNYDLIEEHQNYIFLARKELGFGSEFDIDPNKIIIGNTELDINDTTYWNNLKK